MNNSSNESHRHHFVPKFLLRPWAVNGELRGYWWDERQRVIACKRKGPNAFCNEIDLLTLRARDLGRDALEKLFFGDVDTKGALARDKLLADGPKCLTVDDRCDFARLLLSLEARRPQTVAQLRGHGRREIAEALDNNPEILTALADDGLTETPSSYYERQSDTLLEDVALGAIQRLADNPKIGGKLINAHWHVVILRPSDESFVLSDRPLIRIRDYDHPGAAWVLPLTPGAAFISVNHPANLTRIVRETPRRFAKSANVSSAGQAERFVFVADAHHGNLLKKYLGPPRA